MGLLFNKTDPDFSDDYITVKTASEWSGYSNQYLRRLNRKGVFVTKKIGQRWLINSEDFCQYLTKAISSKDNRYGPQRS